MKSKVKKQLIAGSAVIVLVATIVGYTKFSIKAQLNEQEVVYTKQDIPPRTQITPKMLQIRKVPSQAIPPNAIKDKEDIVGKWTAPGYGISKNSLIYKNKIVSKDDLPDAGILNLEPNEVAFPLLVDLEKSLGNSIIPNTHVDLYFSTKVKDKNNNEKALYGKLASNVRVVAVKDANAANVFDPDSYQAAQDSSNTGNKFIPQSQQEDKKRMAKIYIFAIDEKLNELLNNAKLIGDIVPVANGHSYVKSDDEAQEVPQNEVISYIQKLSLNKKIVETGDNQ